MARRHGLPDFWSLLLIRWILDSVWCRVFVCQFSQHRDSQATQCHDIGYLTVFGNVTFQAVIVINALLLVGHNPARKLTNSHTVYCGRTYDHC